MEHLQAEPALSKPAENTPIAKKRPISNSPTLLSPPSLPPLAQRIRKDIQIGEREVESPEKEVLRSPPILNSLSVSPCTKGIPSPAPLVLTPVPPDSGPEKLSLNCLNCDAKMTHDHQCEALDSDSSWEDIETESEQDMYPTFDPDSENWAEEFSKSIRSFHGQTH